MEEESQDGSIEQETRTRPNKRRPHEPHRVRLPRVPYRRGNRSRQTRSSELPTRWASSPALGAKSAPRHSINGYIFAIAGRIQETNLVARRAPMEQPEPAEPSAAPSDDHDELVSAASAPAATTDVPTPRACATCGATPAVNGRVAAAANSSAIMPGTSPNYVYAIGKIEARFPRLSVEKDSPRSPPGLTRRG